MARPREFDEVKAISQAAAVFWRKGFADTSIGDLEDALSMGRQSIYNAFGDKRALFLLALDQYYEKASEPLQLAFAGEAQGLEAIRRYLEGVVSFQTSTEDRLGCFLTRSLVDHGTLDPDVASKCQNNEKRLYSAFSKALEKASEIGEISDTLDMEAAAQQLCLQVYGLSVMARSGTSRDSLLSSVHFLVERLKA